MPGILRRLHLIRTPEILRMSKRPKATPSQPVVRTGALTNIVQKEYRTRLSSKKRSSPPTSCYVDRITQQLTRTEHFRQLSQANYEVT
ncbi:hypothetical protein T265_04332 [Opisthorchis viverrini]|uniref:Uncharacterized protein n=1 Tax=Opisthorchis viverrini TaxID=6198 RepID=A0A074ZNH8_OPIVI|nr:hypothetical protein T265_04332 [Opisthorchis viverrini]KER28953.1 hypothetical protein T265_04332 [Opisthorchis viverrini]